MDINNSIVYDKASKYAVKIIKLYQNISLQSKEYVLSKQILKSGTSIGANIEEGNGAVSSSDFSNKLAIAYKEARETHYWLRLLLAVELIDEGYYKNLVSKCEELCKMLYKSIKTSKANAR